MANTALPIRTREGTQALADNTPAATVTLPIRARKAMRTPVDSNQVKTANVLASDAYPSPPSSPERHYAIGTLNLASNDLKAEEPSALEWDEVPALGGHPQGMRLPNGLPALAATDDGFRDVAMPFARRSLSLDDLRSEVVRAGLLQPDWYWVSCQAREETLETQQAALNYEADGQSVNGWEIVDDFVPITEKDVKTEWED